MSEEEKRVGSRDFAALCGVAQSTVRRLVKEGRLPPPTFIANKATWTMRQVREFQAREAERGCSRAKNFAGHQP